jgi:hypothetical protein
VVEPKLACREIIQVHLLIAINCMLRGFSVSSIGHQLRQEGFRMRVYRGPSSKPFIDDTHELVSRVPAEQLEEGIRSKALIRFNITKEGYERQAVCTAQFEDGDIIPMISGLLARLNANQNCIKKIQATMNSKSLSDEEKLLSIQDALVFL